MDFNLKDGDFFRQTIALKDSATVIEAGDLVALSSGLIIKATAGSTAVAWCPLGAAAGETKVEVTVGNDFTLTGTGDANFAAADRGTLADIVVSSGTQLIDVSASATDVLKVGISETAGTVGSDATIEVRINKPLF